MFYLLEDLICHCVLLVMGGGGGGGGPATKKIMPPGKLLDVLCLFCSICFFFQNTFKIDVFVCVHKKEQKDHDFCLF